MRSATAAPVVERRPIGTPLAGPAGMESRTAGNGAVRFSGFDVPEFAVRFCGEMGIGEALREALRLAREQFPSALGAAFEVVPGFDAGKRWLIVKVRVPKTLSIAAVADGYDAYALAWVRSVPDDQREPIRLSVNRV